MLALKYGVNVNLRDGHGWPVSIYSSTDSTIKTIQMLLEYGANVNNVDNFGCNI